jgi:hypothetical protein
MFDKSIPVKFKFLYAAGWLFVALSALVILSVFFPATVNVGNLFEGPYASSFLTLTAIFFALLGGVLISLGGVELATSSRASREAEAREAEQLLYSLTARTAKQEELDEKDVITRRSKSYVPSSRGGAAFSE